MKGPPSPPAPDVAVDIWRDARDEYIARVVRGKTFCDVGGLWGTVRERVSVADKAGATDLYMLDVTEPGDPLWKAFRARMDSFGIFRDRWISADVQRYDGPPFDVVHCSGVLYHAPDPVAMLAALRRMTREHLVLSCSVIPGKDARWVALWQQTPEEAAAMATRWRPYVQDTAIGLTRDWPKAPDPTDWAPWYWLPTVPGLIRSAEAAGFRLIDAAPIWHGMAHTLLLKAV